MAVIKKNTKEQIRIEQTEFKGHDLVTIRVYYEDDEGKWWPTKKGITFRQELLGEIIRALKEIEVKEDK